MNKALSLFTLALLPLLILAQDEPSFGIKFSGFVKSDLIWDSRQTVDLREGHFLLFPKPVLEDQDGNDINAKASYNFLNIQTRLRGDIKGPDALGAKTSGAIEAEFFGTTDADMNGFRLRHAYVKLNWKSTELLVGQFWHPLFITASFPEVVSFNTGAPFLVFSRNPQIRLTKDLNSIRIILTALSQVDFKSNGPDGVSSKYIRNSSVPSLNINLEYSKKNSESGKEFLAGVAGNFKRLVPRMQTDSNFKTSEGINSFSGMAYLRIGCPKLVFKLAGLYGQNMHDYTMIGGYAVREVTDAEKGFVTYSNISTLSAWTELLTTGKKMQGGLFLAYAKNMGAGETVAGPYYSRGANIDKLYRISPRFVYNAGKLRIAPELEYTVAYYGKTNNEEGNVIDSEAVGNFRLLIGVFYFF
jgi:hypothetical protein